MTIYRAFDEIDPFTITFVGNLSDHHIDLKAVFQQLTTIVTDFKPRPGKKVKITVLGKPGELLAAKYKIDGVTVVKGIDKGTRAFNNCISMVMTVPSAITGEAEKNIDFKLFKDKIQSTGSRSIFHTESAWDYLKAMMLKMDKVSEGHPLDQLQVVNLSYQMIDKTFRLGFKICREKFKTHIHLVNGFHVIWEAGVHSNGVSVKYPLKEFKGVLVKKKRNDMPPCISFIVFTTGSVIISGNDLTKMKEVYNSFCETVYSIQGKVEFKIKA